MKNIPLYLLQPVVDWCMCYTTKYVQHLQIRQIYIYIYSPLLCCFCPFSHPTLPSTTHTLKHTTHSFFTSNSICHCSSVCRPPDKQPCRSPRLAGFIFGLAGVLASCLLGCLSVCALRLKTSLCLSLFVLQLYPQKFFKDKPSLFDFFGGRWPKCVLWLLGIFLFSCEY